MAQLPRPHITVPKTPGWVNEFRAFIMRGNVVDLAVGIVIGAAFTAIVNSLVRDLFNPLIGLAIGGLDFSDLFVTLKGPHEATLDAAHKAGAVTMNVGLFLNACIQFVIVGFAVFWLVKALSRMHVAGTKEAEAAPLPPTPTEALLMEIRDELRTQKGTPVAPPA
jgi:large conductance mechanosensitive channel